MPLAAVSKCWVKAKWLQHQQMVLNMKTNRDLFINNSEWDAITTHKDINIAHINVSEINIGNPISVSESKKNINEEIL